MDALRKILTGAGILALLQLSSCGTKVADAGYPAQKIYLPAAAASQIYLIDKAVEDAGSVPTEGAPCKFTIDYDEYVFSVPLSVYRSGIDCRGKVNVDIYMDDDVVYDLILSGELDGDTGLIPADLRECRERIAISDGESYASFDVAVDLEWLMDSLQRGKRLAFGISIDSADREPSPDCCRLAVIIDTTIFDNI